ncbi:MAG: DJ-1/PfpI family protein [Clostridiales bacterium]|nr:DJ-1/PfpI family protein [Clostridiales bacterium]
MDINFLFFNDFETLDIFGPIEILSRIENVKAHFISFQGGLIKSKQGHEIETENIATVNLKDVLVIPGGQGTRILVNDKEFISQLTILCSKAEYVLSICTGAALLAKTGLLDNRKATSNKKAFEWVKSISSNVNWIRNARWVVDNKFYTSSGVSAGMDMALGFVSDLFGVKKAKQIAEDIEYIWNKKDSF